VTQLVTGNPMFVVANDTIRLLRPPVPEITKPSAPAACCVTRGTAAYGHALPDITSMDSKLTTVLIVAFLAVHPHTPNVALSQAWFVVTIAATPDREMKQAVS